MARTSQPLKTVTVSQQADEKEIAVEIIAQDISAIAKGFRKIETGQLNRRALVILLQAASGVSQRDIHNVLDNLATLDQTYLNLAKINAKLKK